MSTILVTGASGYLGTQVVAALLHSAANNGTQSVRGQVRSAAREQELRDSVRRSGAFDTGLTAVTADLMSDEGWKEAMTDVDEVYHVASPIPAAQPKDPDELVVPARAGTLRVLRAARDAGVRRVVLTSSFAAIGYSPKPSALPYDETDWTDPTGDVTPYVKSKTLAERAAWDFVADPSVRVGLSVVNPVGIFGPALGPDLPTSLGLISVLVQG